MANKIGDWLMLLAFVLFASGVFSQHNGQYFEQPTPQQTASNAETNINSNGFILDKLFEITNSATRSAAITKDVYDGYDAEQKVSNKANTNSLGPINVQTTNSQVVAQASANKGHSTAGIQVLAPRVVHQSHNVNNQHNGYYNQAYNHNYQYDYYNQQNGYYQYQYQNAPYQHHSTANQYTNQPAYQQPQYHNQPQRPNYNPFTVTRGSFVDDVPNTTEAEPLSPLQTTQQVQGGKQFAMPNKEVTNENGEKLDDLISNVFKHTETLVEPTGGKSLAELLHEQEAKSKEDAPGAEYGLDVRSEKKRRRRSASYPYIQLSRKPHFRRLHHEGYHATRRFDSYNSRNPHYRVRDHGGYQMHSHDFRGTNENHFDCNGIHLGNKKPIHHKPHQIHSEGMKNDTDIIPDIDIRSNFGSDRRKRDIVQRYRRNDVVVFGGAVEEKTFEEKLADMAENKTSAITADLTIDNNTSTEEGEEDEDGELNSRFGFLGGQRRRQHRPLSGLLNGVVGGVLNSIGNYASLEKGLNPNGRPFYPQYSQQYPQQYPQQYTQQSPQQYPQQYIQSNYPHSQQQHHQPILSANHLQQYPKQVANQPLPSFGGPANQQTVGANTQSQNYQNEFGQFQNNAGSSQSSNLAVDGSAGQLSAANTQQQNFQNEFSSGNKNSGQSQSANFDANGNIALTSSNSNTMHTHGANGDRDEANSNAQTNVKNPFGMLSSGAQSDTQNYNEYGKIGQQGHGNSQSTFQGNDGSFSGSHSDAKSETFEGSFGLKGQQSSSHSSSFNNGGAGNTSVFSSAGSGSGFGGAQSGSSGGSNGGGSNLQSSAGANSYNDQLGYQSFGGLPVFG